MQGSRASNETTGLLIGFWGKRGPVSRLMIQAAESVSILDNLRVSLTVSRQNECLQDICRYEVPVLKIDTFRSPAGALLAAWKVLGIRRLLRQEIQSRNIHVFLELMPHVWSPFIATAVQEAGARYVTIAHDAEPHPGDPTAHMKPLLDLALRRADRVIVLSQHVESILISQGLIDKWRIHRAFLPDICYGADRSVDYDRGKTLRMLFFGRMARYKGLELFVSAAELVRAAGFNIEIGVFGAGSLSGQDTRLRALGAEVVNRWISDDEFRDVLTRFDVIVASHTEASQSAVVATAFGAGIPVIATPVGGLCEQIRHGYDGLIASATSSAALAESIVTLAGNSDLLTLMQMNLKKFRKERSMQRFLEACIN